MLRQPLLTDSPKIIVAMSGGIDSAVAAALLKEQGFEISAIFLRLTNLPYLKDSEKKAKQIAKILKIPFRVLDLRKEFQKKIIKNFLKDIEQGITPNPCVVCNKEIKFGLLLKKLKELKIDFDFIATGHYARRSPTGLRREFSIFNDQFSNYKLLVARDKEKDQSYFLWMLSQAQIRKILFPLGNYTKQEVKKIAKKIELSNVVIRESQEICFIKGDINDFLKKHLKLKPDKILDTEGKIIGEHQGLIFYTIGQRKTIGLSHGPYYVLDKDIKKNILIVTKNEKDLYKKELIAKNVHWISGKPPKLPIKVKIKIRYRHKSAIAIITPTQRCVGVIKKEEIKVIFNKPQRAITPGQSVVFYDGQELLGGGIIKR